MSIPRRDRGLRDRLANADALVRKGAGRPDGEGRGRILRAGVAAEPRRRSPRGHVSPSRPSPAPAGRRWREPLSAVAPVASRPRPLPRPGGAVAPAGAGGSQDALGGRDLPPRRGRSLDLPPLSWAPRPDRPPHPQEPLRPALPPDRDRRASRGGAGAAGAGLAPGQGQADGATARVGRLPLVLGVGVHPGRPQALRPPGSRPGADPGDPGRRRERVHQRVRGCLTGDRPAALRAPARPPDPQRSRRARRPHPPQRVLRALRGRGPPRAAGAVGGPAHPGGRGRPRSTTPSPERPPPAAFLASLWEAHLSRTSWTSTPSTASS